MFYQCLSGSTRPAYVTIKIDSKKVAKTTHERDRVWNQTFHVLCAHPPDTTITITLKTKRFFLGKIDIKANELLGETSLINGVFPLCKQNGKRKKQLKLQFLVLFKPAECEQSWEKTLANGVAYQGLKNATFPKRSNCSVVLYQDAHHRPTFQPPIGHCGKPRKLWEDVYNALDGAKHLIYIVGWSFNPNIALVSTLSSFL